MKTITITIGGENNIEVETSGFRGTSCLAETEALKSALGVTEKTTLNRRESSEVHRSTLRGIS